VPSAYKYAETNDLNYTHSQLYNQCRQQSDGIMDSYDLYKKIYQLATTTIQKSMGIT